MGSKGITGIKVMGVGIDGKLPTSTENSQVSRIQFPIIPTGRVIVGSNNETYKGGYDRAESCAGLATLHSAHLCRQCPPN